MNFKTLIPKILFGEHNENFFFGQDTNIKPECGVEDEHLMKGCRSAGPDFEIPAYQGDFLLRHQPFLPHEISPLIRNHVVLEAEKPNLGKRGPGNHFSWTLSR